mmetsp:Transcript_2905/g.7807  ORF Transcript_2905/g.7807 Transcript_2905/m.7807 type:complete len:234 (+) Transcript_2905:726-1427(+)
MPCLGLRLHSLGRLGVHRGAIRLEGHSGHSLRRVWLHRRYDQLRRGGLRLRAFFRDVGSPQGSYEVLFLEAASSLDTVVLRQLLQLRARHRGEAGGGGRGWGGRGGGWLGCARGHRRLRSPFGDAVGGDPYMALEQLGGVVLLVALVAQEDLAIHAVHSGSIRWPLVAGVALDSILLHEHLGRQSLPGVEEGRWPDGAHAHARHSGLPGWCQRGLHLRPFRRRRARSSEERVQ